MMVMTVYLGQYLKVVYFAIVYAYNVAVLKKIQKLKISDTNNVN